MSAYVVAVYISQTNGIRVAAVSAGFVRCFLTVRLFIDSQQAQLALATFINLFSSRVYGEFEFWFSATKVLTIVGISEHTSSFLSRLIQADLSIVISSLFVDFGVGNLP